MNRFNLTFRGDILPDTDPAQVKTSLGELFGIDDPAKLAACFSGETVILRRNLDRKEAADLYASLAKIGARGELVTISQRGLNSSDTPAPEVTTDLTPPDTVDTVTATTIATPARATTAAPSKAPAKASAGGADGGTTYAVGSRPSRTAAKTKVPPVTPPELRRADLVTENHLENSDAEELVTKEEALKEALRAKQKQTGKDARDKERARKKEEAVEAGRHAALEKAQRSAQLLEKKRKAAEQAALKKTEQERIKAQQQVEREEQARLQRERKAQARREREEQARQQHEREAQARREQEEQARQQREREAQARREQEEQTRQQREREAQARREQEEQTRQQRERKAEQRRQKAEQAAAKTAAQAAARAEEKSKAEKLAAMIKADAAALKKKKAEELARRKAEEQRLKAEEQAHRKQVEAEQAAQLKAMEEQAIARAAAELTSVSITHTTKPRVKTSLELPHRKHGQQEQSGTESARTKRQPGAPNLYTLRPFRNTPDIQARAQQSARSMKRAYIIATVALAALLLTVLAVSRLPAPPRIGGASALAIDPRGGPLLLTSERLFQLDRSGADSTELSLESLGLAKLSPPLSFAADGSLLARGQAQPAETAAMDAISTGLVNCTLTTPACQGAAGELATGNISGMTINPLDGAIFLADSSNGSLRKVSPEGDLLASAELEIPSHPILRLDSGLLLINSTQAPAIRVYRYENEAFGEQLDEIQVLPLAVNEPGDFRIWDFAWMGNSWWVVLYDPANPATTAGLYRYDAQWQSLGQVELTAGSWPLQLAPWGEKMLVLDPSHIPIQRFNARGDAEAALVPNALQATVDTRQQATKLQALSARIALAVLGLLLVTAWLAGFGHRVRSMVYTTCRGRGAEPVDELAASINWVDPAADRLQRVRRTCISYALLAIALVALAIGLGCSVIQLSALLLALAGPAVALLLVQRSDSGYIGVLNERLILVDHTDMYHMGEGPRIQYRGPFLMIDDVTVFTGSSLLPAFNTGQVQQQVMPLAHGGVKVDRRIAMVKLLQGRHPVALGLIAILGCCALAIAVLTLHGIY